VEIGRIAIGGQPRQVSKSPSQPVKKLGVLEVWLKQENACFVSVKP
jgi:hypothetical protein